MIMPKIIYFQLFPILSLDSFVLGIAIGVSSTWPYMQKVSFHVSADTTHLCILLLPPLKNYAMSSVVNTVPVDECFCCRYLPIG